MIIGHVSATRGPSWLLGRLPADFSSVSFTMDGPLAPLFYPYYIAFQSAAAYHALYGISQGTLPTSLRACFTLMGRVAPYMCSCSRHGVVCSNAALRVLLPADWTYKNRMACVRSMFRVEKKHVFNATVVTTTLLSILVHMSATFPFHRQLADMLVCMCTGRVRFRWLPLPHTRQIAIFWYYLTSTCAMALPHVLVLSSSSCPRAQGAVRSLPPVVPPIMSSAWLGRGGKLPGTIF